MFTFYSKPNSEHNRNERVTFVGNFSDGILKIAAARCSKKDQFARKKGFQIAQGRLMKDKLIFSQEVSSCDASQFVQIAKELSEGVIKSKVVLLTNRATK